MLAGLSLAAVASAEACGFDGEGQPLPPFVQGDATDVVPSLPVLDGARPDAGGLVCPPVATVIPDGGERQVYAVHRRASLASDAGATDADAGDADAGDPRDADAGDAAFPLPDTSAWRGCTSFVLDRTTAAQEVKDDGGVVKASARVALEWDETALYVAIDVDDPVVEGISNDPYANDSFEIYASGFGTVRTGDYTKLDHHYIVDHSGASFDYSADILNPKPYPSRTVRTPAGYRIEARIGADELGGPLGAGETLWFDALLNDGIMQRKYLVWAMTPHASCSCDACACNYSPAYDTLLFAPFTLVP
ncbi:MAG: hypothetical protein JWP87_5797 [Labilithrix sp.]|nr:hypothetical protein [Labilithrix sp.]